MKCNEAAKLMHKYLDGNRTPAEKEMLERHLTDCPECRKELALVRRLLLEGPGGEGVKAPESLTDRVMAAIYGLPPEGRPRRAGAQSPDDRWKPVYRRLGYSLILTAGIIMFSVVAPGAGLHPDAVSEAVRSGVENSGQGFRNTLTHIDNGIMGILKSRSNPETDIEGGT